MIMPNESNEKLDLETETLANENMAQLSETMGEGLGNILDSTDTIKFETLAEDLSITGEILGYLRTKEDDLRENKQYQELMMRLRLYRDVLIQECRRKDEILKNLLYHAVELRTSWHRTK